MANVEQIDIADLSPDPANLRSHPQRNRDAARASLQRFKAARSIVVDGKNVVRAGNATLEAARAVGISKAIVVDADGDQLVVVRRKDWSDTEATAYGIADNRITDLSEFSDTDLASTLRSLQSEDFDLGAVGYTDDEVDALVGRLAGEIAGEEVDDPAGEWAGMPEFAHEDQTSRFKAIVHFRNEEDLREFEGLMGQKVPRDRWAIWHPKAEIGHYAGKQYEADPAISGLRPDQGPVGIAADDQVS